jgi:hypothetical protein
MSIGAKKPKTKESREAYNAGVAAAKNLMDLVTAKDKAIKDAEAKAKLEEEKKNLDEFKRLFPTPESKAVLIEQSYVLESLLSDENYCGYSGTAIRDALLSCTRKVAVLEATEKLKSSAAPPGTAAAADGDGDDDGAKAKKKAALSGKKTKKAAAAAAGDDDGDDDDDDHLP